MNVKRFAIACVAVYLAYHAVSVGINVLVLGETYATLTHVFRPEPEMMSRLWIQLVTSAVWTVLFCYVFTRGYEGRGTVEGIRYGLLIGLMIGIPLAYETYMLFPITLGLAHAWAVTSVVLGTVCGFVLALVYRPTEV